MNQDIIICFENKKIMVYSSHPVTLYEIILIILIISDYKC